MQHPNPMIPDTNWGLDAAQFASQVDETTPTGSVLCYSCLVLEKNDPFAERAKPLTEYVMVSGTSYCRSHVVN